MFYVVFDPNCPLQEVINSILTGGFLFCSPPDLWEIIQFDGCAYFFHPWVEKNPTPESFFSTYNLEGSFPNVLHPQKLTWNLEMVVSNRNLLFQGAIFRFHVCFGGIDLLGPVLTGFFSPKNLQGTDDDNKGRKLMGQRSFGELLVIFL